MEFRQLLKHLKGEIPMSPKETKSDSSSKTSQNLDINWNQILGELDAKNEFKELNWEGSFNEYLGMVSQNPYVARNAFQRMYDMILSWETGRVQRAFTIRQSSQRRTSMLPIIHRSPPGIISTCRRGG